MEWIRTQWAQLTWSEVAGSLGDLGVFIPFLVGLAQHVGLDVGTTLVGTGIYNIICGAVFGIPIPVQPMKNIGAVAIAEDLTLDQTLAAGILTSAWVFLIAVLPANWEGRRLADVVTAVIPLPLVKGIQMGLGLSLARRGIKHLVLDDDENLRDWLSVDGLLTAAFCVTFAVMFRERLSADGSQSEAKDCCEAPVQHVRFNPPSHRAALQNGVGGDNTSEESGSTSGDLEESLELREKDADASSSEKDGPRADGQVPTALVLFIVGLILTFATSDQVAKELKWGPSTPEAHDLDGNDFRYGFIEGALPQIPLTTLNSVVAVSALSYELFGDRGASASNIALSVSILNLIGCWFGIMPVCHGAGGLAAQHRFGARYGTAVIFLGVAKILLGILFGSSLELALDEFPETVLGALLLVAGLELAISGLKQSDEVRKSCLGQGWFILLLTAITALVYKTFIGFAAGTTAVVFLYTRWWVQERFSRQWQPVDQ